MYFDVIAHCGNAMICRLDRGSDVPSAYWHCLACERLNRSFPILTTYTFREPTKFAAHLRGRLQRYRHYKGCPVASRSMKVTLTRSFR